MRSDDLVPLLAPSPGPAVGFRQGVIITWDADTAENTVLVGNSVMTNLPILNTSEAAILAAGDVVGILTAGQTWGILGRFTIPGTPEAVSGIKSITNRIVAAEDPSTGSRNSTSWGDLTGTSVGPSTVSRIGPSGRALAFWSCEMGQTVDGSGFLKWSDKITPHVGLALSGANVQSPTDAIALNVNLEHNLAGPDQVQSYFWIQAAMMHLYTGLAPGDTTFTMKYRHDGLLPSSGNTVRYNARELAIFAL